MTAVTPTAEPIRRADQIQRWSVIWSTFAFAMLMLICLIGAWTLREVDNSDSWVDHTFTVIGTSQQLMANLRDTESATRAYIPDPNERFRSEFQLASARIQPTFNSLKTLTLDNPQQQQRLDQFQPLLNERVKNLARTMTVRDSAGAAAADSLNRNDANQALSRHIRELSRDFESEEYRLLQGRSALRRTRTRQGLAGTIGAASLALIALIVAPFQVRRAVRQRDFANREKQESDSMVHSLFDAAPQSILIADRNGSIVMANPVTEKIFGYNPDELRQMPIETLLPERLRSGHVGHRDRFFANPQTRPMGLNLDLKARRKDGSEFHAEISLSYIEAARGTLAVAFASDISKRRADEQAIREQREELRQLAGRLMTAQEEERRRIARNLHDDLSQSLACISMDLGKLASKESFAEVSPHLRPLQKRATEAADLVRKVSHQLHPAILDDLGLKTALEEFCDEFQQRSGIHTQLSFHNAPPYLPAELSSCVYYIVGECLRNIAKHAKALSALIDLEVLENSLCLCVKDDGIGFNGNPSKPRGGIGVTAMKERVRLQGGTFAIQSSAEDGTRIDVAIPLSVSGLDH